MFDAGRHGFDACGFKTLGYFVGKKRRGEVDISHGNAKQGITNGSTDYARRCAIDA